MAKNPLLDLQDYGQSVWYDFIRRNLITSGELEDLIANDGVAGITSNPSIFEKAIAGSDDYDEAVRTLQSSCDLPAHEIYEHLAIDDIRRAADLLASVHESTKGRDGYVSLEVSPHLAQQTEPTIAEAKRLWAAVDRPNVMIKVPGTAAGLPAIRRLIGDGINVNVTLLFAQEVYEAVADAFIGGLEERVAAGKEIGNVASVASFFVSRIDTLIDRVLDERLAATTDDVTQGALRSLLGKVAIANAKLTYVAYQRIFGNDRWRALADRGGQTQRLLWASTSTKNPDYPATLYVDELIGADTVNTVPVATLADFREHGRPRPSLTEGIDDARDTMARLADVGISMQEITSQLVDQGVQLFADAFDQLLGAIERKRRELLGTELNEQTHAIGSRYADGLTATLEEWRRAGKVRHLWSGDAKVWTGADENQWLGWLHLSQGAGASRVDDAGGDVAGAALPRLAEEIRKAGFQHVLLLGMGGSSLCPEVLARTFGRIAGHPELHVLDSTVPAQIRAAERAVDLERTLCIVSSKSGGTTETTMLQRYFFDRIGKMVGPERAGSHFIAITDPGSSLEETATTAKFRHVLPGIPSVGGRFSALSNFGLVPAAIAGIDTTAFLVEAERMAHSCAASVPPAENPGVTLGALLGTLARAGRDKLTIIASPRIGTLGTWLEQLIAESTGKNGHGIIPVADEHLGTPAVYGEDRLFAYARLTAAPDAGQDEAIAALERAGHPVVRIAVNDAMDLGEEFFRWEIATAAAGAILGINPFNQPDVEAAKVATRSLTTAYERTGTLDEPPARFADAGVHVFADDRNAAALGLGTGGTLDGALRALIGTLRPGDYFGMNAYVAMSPAHHDHLQAIRHSIRDRHRVATTLGYGPRFLHSTGQLHKGGPNTGVFLQITGADAEDLPIPGQRVSFGVLKDAQALGDFHVLAERGRRLLRLHLGPDIAGDLARLAQIVRGL